MANVFLLSLTTSEGRELVGTPLTSQSMRTVSSPHACRSHHTCNITNEGRLIARPSSDYAIGDSMDGALMPYSHTPRDYTRSSYKRLLSDARRLLPAYDKTFLLAHYARNGLKPNQPFDPANLREQIETDIAPTSPPDGAVVWSMPLAVSGVSTRTGIFSEHHVLPEAGKPGPLITFFPAYQVGYFGWFQRFVSHDSLPANGSQALTLALRQSNQKPVAPGSPTLFTKSVYIRTAASGADPAAVFYSAPAEGRVCASAGHFPCPGSAVNTSRLDVGNASCQLVCENKLERTLSFFACHFFEIFEHTIAHTTNYGGRKE